MKNISPLKNFFKADARHVVYDWHRSYRDWKIIIITTLILLAISGYFAFSFYNHTKEGLSSNVFSVDMISPVSINRSLMEEVVDYYKGQEKLFEEAKKASVQTADPSI
jgi:hypothetical protein